MQLTNKLKIAITGEKGQLAQELLNRLSGKVTIASFCKNELNISDMVSVSTVLKQFRPDIIINCAAYTAVDKAESEPMLAESINHEGVFNLAKVSTELDSTLIHISTDYVFDGESNSPYLESDRPNPQNVYGATKLAGETAIASICTKHIIIRTSWLFSEYGNNFVKTMLRLAGERSELNIIDNQIGGPTFAGDLANAIISICNRLDDTFSEYGIYHFGGYPYVSWYSFANEIFTQAYVQQVISKIPRINPVPATMYPTPAKRPLLSMLNCSKIKRVFDVEPSNWRAELNNIYKYK